MNFEEKIKKLLKRNMTAAGFELWGDLNSALVNIWEKSSSSSMRYHLAADGSVHSIGEHTFEMLNGASKTMRAFKIDTGTVDCDVLMFAVVLHDSVKYGPAGERRHTDNTHDRLAADMIKNSSLMFHTVMSTGHLQLLEDCVRYHSGRWSTDAGKDFSFGDFHPLVQFVHMLDMLSANDCLK